MLQMYFAEFAFFVSAFFLVTEVHSQGISFEGSAATRSPDRRPCDASRYYCTRLRGCRPLRDLPNWENAGETCGSGSGLSRRVCCPRQNPPPTPERPRTPERPPTPQIPRATEGPRTTEKPGDDECGQPMIDLTPLVMGGENATEGAWPWMAAITIRARSGVYTPWCTGFLVDRKHVISAAHCFHTRRDGLYSTRIGSVDQKRAEEYPVSNIVVPEGYRPGRYYDDIAILTLTREVNHPGYNPICLPDAEVAGRNLDGFGTTVAGWGAEGPDGPPTIHLKQLSDIPVVPIKDCDRIFREKLSGFRRKFPRGITERLICAGFIKGQRDACGGDSGGPLMLEHEDSWFAVGVVSFGSSCGEPEIPGGYTRVSTHLRWIRENTRN